MERFWVALDYSSLMPTVKVFTAAKRRRNHASRVAQFDSDKIRLFSSPPLFMPLRHFNAITEHANKNRQVTGRVRIESFDSRRRHDLFCSITRSPTENQLYFGNDEVRWSKVASERNPLHGHNVGSLKILLNHRKRTRNNFFVVSRADFELCERSNKKNSLELKMPVISEVRNGRGKNCYRRQSSDLARTLYWRMNDDY